MTITEAPWGNLAPTPLAFGKQGGLLLHDQEAVPPVPEVEVVPQAVTGPRGTWADGKGAMTLIFAPQKSDVKDLRDVFHLTDRKPVPVNLWLRTMNMLSIHYHKYRGKL